MVAQNMVGTKLEDEDTDPAMLITLPVSRWHRKHYAHALPHWLPVDIDIIPPIGASVTVTGIEQVGPFVAVGSMYQVAHVRFDSDPGLVEIAGDQPIAVHTYATSSNWPTSF